MCYFIQRVTKEKSDKKLQVQTIQHNRETITPHQPTINTFSSHLHQEKEI
jgi:hypothetical protein